MNEVHSNDRQFGSCGVVEHDFNEFTAESSLAVMFGNIYGRE